MTVETTERFVIYPGNGAATVFSFEFVIPNSEVITVSLQDPLTKEILEVLAPGTYLVTGYGDPEGGTVTYPLSGPPLGSDKNIFILRTMPYTQDLSISNQGGFYPETVEQQLDFIVMQIQQIAEEQSRSLIVLPGQTPPDTSVIVSAQGYAEQAEEARDAAQGYVSDAADEADAAAASAATAANAVVSTWLAAAQDSSFINTDELLYLSGNVPKRGSFLGLRSSIFNGSNIISNGFFSDATFRLYKNATVFYATIDATALTANRNIVLPNADVNLGNLDKKWTELAPIATTSGTSFNFSSLPSGLTDIELWFAGVSGNSTDSFLLQIGTGGSPTTTGYSAASGFIGAAARVASTIGFPIYSNLSTYMLSGKISLHKITGNTWVSEHSMCSDVSGGGGSAGGGFIALAGVLDNMRLSSIAGTQAFDAGSVQLRYK
jgi:hypothetical protein